MGGCTPGSLLIDRRPAMTSSRLRRCGLRGGRDPDRWGSVAGGLLLLAGCCCWRPVSSLGDFRVNRKTNHHSGGRADCGAGRASGPQHAPEFGDSPAGQEAAKTAG